MISKSILILEDDILTADRIESYLKKLGYIDIRKAHNYDRAIEFVEKRMPNITLLDIRLGKEKTGIDFAQYLRALRSDVKIIFLTAQMDKDNIFKIREVKPDGYIPKPIKLEPLMAVLEFSFVRNSDLAFVHEKEKVATLNVDGVIYKITIDAIKYIETKHVYSFIYMRGEDRARIFRLSMRKLLETLPNETFVRTHRSFAVNLKYSDQVSKMGIKVDNNLIPISRGRYRSIKEAFESYHFSE